MLSRRSLLRRTAKVIGTLAFADVLGLEWPAVAFGTTYQVSPQYRTQFDGSYCCATNCLMASGAMLRSTVSQNSYNPSSASVRMWWNHYNYGNNCAPGSYSMRCTVSDTCSKPPYSYLCPDNPAVGTPMSSAFNALLHPEDGGGTYNVHLYNQLSWTNFSNDLKPAGGYSAVVVGNYAQDPHQCDSFTGGHAVYVLGCDATGSSFTVYDPDNAYGCSQPISWTAAQLAAFTASYAGSGWVACILGRYN